VLFKIVLKFNNQLKNVLNANLASIWLPNLENALKINLIANNIVKKTDYVLNVQLDMPSQKKILALEL